MRRSTWCGGAGRSCARSAAALCSRFGTTHTLFPSSAWEQSACQALLAFGEAELRESPFPNGAWERSAGSNGCRHRVVGHELYRAALCFRLAGTPGRPGASVPARRTKPSERGDAIRIRLPCAARGIAILAWVAIRMHSGNQPTSFRLRGRHRFRLPLRITMNPEASTTPRCTASTRTCGGESNFVGTTGGQQMMSCRDSASTAQVASLQGQRVRRSTIAAARRGPVAGP